MALTQRKPNSSEPLRPILGRKLKPGGGGSAKRALSFLGSSNRRANLRLAESLLTISASEFRSKWNFDPLTETPLPQGQFLWTPMKPTESKVPLELVKTKAECDLATCYKLPQKESIARLSEANTNCKDNKVTVQPMDQTCKFNEVSVKPVDQTCKDLRCLSVKSNECSTINKCRNISFKRPLCSDIENNNVLTQVSISRSQRQSTITEFLRSSKQPVLSSVSRETPTGSSTMGSIAEKTTLPPSKRQRITSDDGETS